MKSCYEMCAAAKALQPPDPSVLQNLISKGSDRTIEMMSSRTLTIAKAAAVLFLCPVLKLPVFLSNLVQIVI